MTASTAEGLAVVTRPNGKVYRARKPPTIIEALNSSEEAVLIVLRTHDERLARLLFGERFGLGPFDARAVWLREVPWDTTGIGTDRSMIDDPERGIPALEFG